MKYFTIKEFVRSETATANGIDNTPSEEINNRITEFVEVLLDPLRDTWSRYCKRFFPGQSPALRVTSGYRCPELNRKVKGSPTSAHVLGYAADIVPMNGHTRSFYNFCMNYLSDKAFDQLIWEVSGKSEWVHIGFKTRDGLQRKQVFSIVK